MISKTETISAKKQHILEQAALLFREKGYAASTMRDLAERVGVEPSSLYNHIKSKSEILRDICLSNGGRFTEGIKEIISDFQDPSDQLRQVIRLHISIAIEDNSSITVFNDEWRHLDEESLGEFLRMRKFYEKTLKGILQEGIGSGQWQHHNIDVMMNSLLSSFRWLHENYRKNKHGDVDQLCSEMAELWLKGIEKR